MTIRKDSVGIVMVLRLLSYNGYKNKAPFGKALLKGGKRMKNLLTINPTTAAGAIGLAIDLAVLENTARLKPEIDQKQIIAMLNGFTTCKKIEIIYDGVDYNFTFSPEEIVYNLNQILRWIIDLEAYVQYFYTNGFYCIDKDGLKFSMRYYN